MKNQLLALLLLVCAVQKVSSQCMPSNDCNAAPLFCGYFIDQYWGSTAATSFPTILPDFCGTQEIPQYFRVFACSWELDMVVEPYNCLNGNGIQIALYDSCTGNLIACDPGQVGGAGLPLHLNAPTVPNTEYLVMIDGYAGDVCDFHITVNYGLDMDDPASGSNQQGQDGYIEFDTLTCGPAQLTAHLPTCLGGGGSGGCSVSWPTSLATNDCISLDWNLPPGVQIVSDDPNALTITIQFNQPVTNGVVSVSASVSNCGEICPTCLDGIGCLSGTIPPITISSDSATYTYRPCQSAPSYCLNTLDGATISTLCTFSGFGWLDQLQPGISGQNDFCFPVDNPNLYEFSACEDNITLNLTVSNCEHGHGLEFAALHGYDCNYFEQLGSCVTIKEDKSGQLTFPNLYPGQPIYLVVDGLDFDACEFHVEVADGNNVAVPVYLETSCQPEITAPGTAICTGGTYTFSIKDISGTGCLITGWGGIFNSCAPPFGACQLLDSMVVNWTLPPFVHAIGNSTGEQITVWVDSTFAGVDTLLSATINADILTVATPTGTIDGFCGCSNFSKQFEAEITVDLVSAVNKIPLQLDCVQPCKTYNGVVYCDPGEYNLSQTGCVTNKLVVTKIPPPVVSAPSIQQNGSDYTVSFNITPSVGSVVTGGQGLLQNGVFVSAPIACGVPYSFEVNTAACSQPVAGAAACFLPPDCTNFNLPAAPGDSCHEAPLLCGNFLDGYCSSTAGLLPDQPAYLTSPLPDFENNGWLRFAPCEDSIAIDFQVFDCQTGDELGFFLLSGDCDTMTPLAFVSAADGNTTSMNVGGLTPGEVYYLVIDGFYGAECKFQSHVVSGIGTASPGAATCDCIDGYIDGPDDLCPADIAVYTLIDPVCTITSDPPIGGNGIYCPPPEEVCPAPAKDSVVLHWVIPPFMNFLSDSINVKTITVQVDSSLLGIDTVLMGTVSIYWEHIPLPGDTAVVDTNAFCTCAGIACTPGYTFKNVEVRHDVDYEYGILNCINPCYFFNGQIYCQPGNYLVSQTNCLTQYLILVDDFFVPNISAGSDQTICYGTDVVLGGNSSSSPLFSYNWSSGGTSPQITVAPPATTTYSLTVTNTFNGCTSTDNVTVTVLPPIPPHNLPPVTVCEGDCIMLAGDLVCPTSSGLYFTVLVSWLGCDSLVSRFITVQPPSVVDLGVVGTLTCGQPCVTYGGQQYCQPGTYSVTGNCEIQEFQIAEDLSIPTVQLGVVGTLTCGQPCVTFNGQQYCQPGTYSVTGNCEIQEFQIAEDLSIPTVQLGVVGTLTCAQPCVTYGGQQYCQPGTYSVTGNCEIQEFQIAEDLSVPTVQLGVVDTLTCAQPCVTFNGQEYCQPGTYSVTGNCEIQEFQIAEDLSVPTVQLGVVGTLTCAQPCVTYGGQQYCQPGTYSVTGNCEIQEFQIAEDLSVPTVQLGVVGTLTCAQPCVTYGGQQYCQPGTYSVTGNCEIQEFQIAEDLSVPTVQLGVVGTLTCAQPCVTYGGQQYCQPGTYSVTGNCEIQEFQIAEDLSVPTVQLGVVGTLTCGQPCVTYGGQQYCQPGTYSVTANCEIQEFQIAEDLSVPTVQLGVVGTLTCAQPCVTYGGQQYCQPGTYSVTANCEIQEFEILATVQPTLDLGVDKTIVAGESVELEGQTDAQPDVISWYGNSNLLNDNGLILTVQPVENTLYTLEILDINGCQLEASVWVYVTPVPKNWYAPNVFQPGSTGINAYFTLFSADGVVSEIRSLEIYNRWGELVFVRQHFAPGVPELGWDGYGKGKMLDPAVFVWHAELLLSDGTSAKVKGDVTLVR